jgi:hypothetical protein
MSFEWSPESSLKIGGDPSGGYSAREQNYNGSSEPILLPEGIDHCEKLLTPLLLSFTFAAFAGTAKQIR